jgi:hypothetical protein
MWSGGDYPPWLQQKMDWIARREVWEQYGIREATSLNGTLWSVPRENLKGVGAAFSVLHASAHAGASSHPFGRWNLKKSKKMKRRTVELEKIHKHGMAGRTTGKNLQMTARRSE